MHALFLTLGLLVAQDAAAESVRLAGTVKDDQGQPQANVLIHVVNRDGRGPNATDSTRTNERGEFHLTVKPRSGWLTFVTALKHGWSSKTLRLDPRAMPWEPLEFAFKPAAMRMITVLDPEGKPAAGAK